MGLLDIRRRILLNTPHLETASGDIATFETDMVAPLHKLTVDIEPVQDLSHGNPSPDNICPIEGWEGAKVTRTGANLVDFNVNNLYAGKLSSTGGVTSTSSQYLKHTRRYPIKGGVTLGVYFGGVYSDSELYTCFFDTEGTFLSSVAQRNRSSLILNVPDKASLVSFSYHTYYYTGLMVTVNDPASEYMPYSGTTIPITFTAPSTGDPMTVYGGDITINSDGSGVIANGKHLFDVVSGGSWTSLGENGGYTSWYKNVTFPVYPAGDASNDLCNMLQPVSAINATNLPDFPAICLMRGNSSSIRLSLPTAEAATSEDVNTWLTNNAVQVLYDRITTINTAIETDGIIQLRGQNNMWSDTGAVRAYYWKHGVGVSSQDYTLLEEYLAKWFFTEDFYIPNANGDGAYHFYHSIGKLNVYSGSGSSYKNVNITGTEHIKRTGAWGSIGLRDTDFRSIPQVLKDLTGKVVRLHIHIDIVDGSGVTASGVAFRTMTDSGYSYNRIALGTGNDVSVIVKSDTINRGDDMAIFAIVRSRPVTGWFTYYFTIDDE